MKAVLKAMTYGLIFAVMAGILAITAAVRLAPSEPAKWHIAISDGAPLTPGPCAKQVRSVRKGARATCLLPGNPTSSLTALDRIARATPRTTLLAGTASEGRITWVSRSKLIGFPDYITAEARQTPDGARLDIFSRQRFGNGDWGVNAARLRLWLAGLDRSS